MYEPVEMAQPTTLAATNNQNAYPTGSTNARYHIVTKHDTLYGIARVYYGDQRRWKEIYAANRNEILDPNMIRVGQRLLIP
jgi:nucleoid-associated protein YgaU